MKIIKENKKGLFNYEILNRYEAGIILDGWEVKSIKAGNISLKESYVVEDKGKIYLVNAHVSKWPGAQIEDGMEKRRRELLLNKNEINRIITLLKTQGLTIIPLNVHLSGPRIKLDIALAKGLKKYDKREKIKKRDSEMQIKRDLKKMGFN